MTSAGMLLMIVVVWALAACVLLATAIPLWDTNRWWVRILDFPRLQIAIAGVVVLVAALFLPGVSRLLVPVLMVIACGYQLWRIFPYTAFAREEMQLAPDGPDAVKVLSSNVLMENERHDLLIGVIERFDPDILYLMETDQKWLDALEPVLARYSTVVREPKDNHYGMVFATRLEVDEARVVYLTDGETPSLYAHMTGPDGTVFRFVGLHPRPPVPGENTGDRDAKILYSARFARQSGVPLIVTGDFNDVAWSDTSRTFKHVGQYLDPRIGRGFYASFDADKFYLRFPIDQLFVTEEVAVVSLKRLDYVGSDHFPMAATLRLDAALAATLNASPEPVSDEDLAEIERSVERTRDELGHTLP